MLHLDCMEILNKLCDLCVDQIKAMVAEHAGVIALFSAGIELALRHWTAGEIITRKLCCYVAV